MPTLFGRIREAVEREEYIIGSHADDRLRERGIPAWQVIGGLAMGKMIQQRPHDMPNPVVEVEQLLPDGTPIKAVWAWLPERIAKLITVHYFDD